MSGVKAGIMLSAQYFEGADMVSALEEQIAMVRLARDRGWDSYFCGQHYLNEGGNQGLQMVPYLARLAADAGDMTLGVGLLLAPLHNPVYTAETIATLDVISRGNMVFGVGLGYRTAEFEAFGVRKGQRVQRFEECLTIAKRLWTEDKVSYESDTCILRDAHLSLKCVQQPHPPIWFAAKHANAIRRAAQLGDCLYHSPKATLATHKERLTLYKEELRKAGKPLPKENPCRIEIYCAKNRAAAMEWGCRILEQVQSLRPVRPEGHAGARADQQVVRRAGRGSIRDRLAGGLLESAQALHRGTGCDPLRIPHAVPRYAALQRLGQHATAVRGVAAGSAQRQTYSPGENHTWVENPLTIRDKERRRQENSQIQC
jgi:alkanesulfonate monooxygenase SsuD/methylene tetrahydromethanopterin reductase-like flavin-dependent oxidoreductase (luciferase family)